jgi:hypothetical protein
MTRYRQMVAWRGFSTFGWQLRATVASRSPLLRSCAKPWKGVYEHDSPAWDFRRQPRLRVRGSSP